MNGKESRSISEYLDKLCNESIFEVYIMIDTGNRKTEYQK